MKKSITESQAGRNFDIARVLLLLCPRALPNKLVARIKQTVSQQLLQFNATFNQHI